MPVPAAPVTAPGDSVEVVAAIKGYHAALAAGDCTAAVALLVPDAVILESGGLETRAEYISHHLPGDIAFASAGQSEQGPIQVTVRGVTAWAVSTSTTRGEYRGRPINSAGAELMVLTRTPEGRRISAVHWSSRTVRS